MAWPSAPLREVIAIHYGKSLSAKVRRAGTVPVFGSNGVVGYHDEPLVHHATIVIGRKGSVGELNFCEVPSFPIDTTFYVEVMDASRVSLKYLYRAMKSINLKRHIIAVGVPGINREDIYKEEIPLPPLAEQQRIVEILDRAAAIQRLRRAAEEKAREIIPALFVDMFGDPVTNPKGWPVGPLRAAADIGSGVTKGRKIDSKATIEVPYLRVANVQDGFLDLTEIKTITIMETEREKYALAVGDMVMTEGGDLDKLGRGYVWNGELPYCAHQNHVFRVRSDRAQVDPLFLAAFIQSFAAKSYFLRVAKRTTGIASINKTQLGDMPLWLPSVKLQQEFGRHVSAVNSMTALVVSATKLGQDAAGALAGSMLAAS
jgi:type I restriction enzyme S subunit